MIIPRGIRDTYPNGSRLPVSLYLFGEGKDHFERFACGECRCAFRFGEFKCAVDGKLDADFATLT